MTQRNTPRKRVKAFKQKFKRNPVGARNLKILRAVELYEAFSGERAEEIGTVDFPDNPGVALAIGPILGLAYETVRDGVREKYYHAFKSSARPLLVASPDGRQLFILGGEYTFTDRGIVDG